MVTKRLQYRYDAVGNKVGMTDADGGLFTYTYDVMRRLTGVINPLGERTTYVYDLNGRRTSAQLANGTRTSYSYDQGSRVQQIHTLKSNNSTVAKFDYAYDDNGRRTSVLEADGSRVTWTYDGTSQVTSEWRTGTSPLHHTFVYDTRGNRTLKVEDGARTTLVYDAANQLSSSQDAGGTTNYTYDGNGNQHVTVAPGASRTTQIWDYENRLVKTLQPGGGVSTMAYDADGLRVRKETPSETKLFVWDDQNYLTETDDSGVTEVAYTTEPSTYGSTISHRTGGATTTYHFDALAATRMLTNTSETVLESYNYTAFGTILGTPTLLGPFLWGGLVGYYWDADLVTQYIRARHYQPHIARWISLDPIGFAGGDSNLFRYVGNSPTSGGAYGQTVANMYTKKAYPFYEGFLNNAALTDPSGLTTAIFDADAFIPWDWVNIPPDPRALALAILTPFAIPALTQSYVKGDNRNPSNTPLRRLRTRMYSYISVNTCACGGGTNKSPVLTRGSGINDSTRKDIIFFMAGIAPWVRYTTDTGTIASQESANTRAYNGGCLTLAKLEAQGNVPFSIAALPIGINYTYSVLLIHTGATIAWWVVGTHDGFPGHELYLRVNQTMAMRHNFIPPGSGWADSPGRLSGYIDPQKVISSGVVNVPDRCECKNE